MYYVYVFLSCFLAQRYRVGSLPNIQHGVSGELFIEKEGDSYKFVIEKFNYDALGPGAVVYVYFRGQTVRSSGGGTVIPYSARWVTDVGTL